MNSPPKDKLRKRGPLKMLRLPMKLRERLAKPELLHRGLTPNQPQNDQNESKDQSQQDQDLVSPDLPPLTVCGGLVRRYVVTRSPAFALPAPASESETLPLLTDKKPSDSA